MARELPANYESLQREDYKRLLSYVHDTLLDPVGPDRLRYGPTYQVPTSRGEALTISTLYSPIPKAYGPLGGFGDGSEIATPTWFIIAQDVNGEIVGHRETAMANRNDEYYDAKGDIAVARRGQGLATAIELVHFDILQRWANEEGLSIVYTVEDANKRKLTELQQLYEDNPTPESYTLLNQKRIEHDRWLTLYGDNGKLRFRGREKNFFSEDDYMFVPLDRLEEVQIDRFDDQDLNLGGAISYPITVSSNSLEMRERKKQNYLQVLLPKIEAIIQV